MMQCALRPGALPGRNARRAASRVAAGSGVPLMEHPKPLRRLIYSIYTIKSRL
jgi:hypothetical protein